MRIRHALGQHNDDGIAADIGAAPPDLAMRVEHNTVSLGIAPRKPVFAWQFFARRFGIGPALGEFGTGDAADHPGIAAELVMNLLEPVGAGALRTPAAGMGAAIQ